jgi:hypothetical protein
MMNMMHVSENYGYLGNKGKAYTPEAIARYCGASLEEYLTLLTELDSVGVPRRNSDRIIYSKRMVEDEKKRKQWRARQSKCRKNNKIEDSDVTQMSRDCLPDLHSSSSSSSSKSVNPAPETGAALDPCPECGKPKQLCKGHSKKKSAKAWPSRDDRKERSYVKGISARSKGEERARLCRERAKVLFGGGTVDPDIRRILQTRASN